MLLTRKINLRQFIIYLSLTAFSLLFTMVYYMNSYGMTDAHLDYLFLAPSIISLIYLLFFIFKYEQTSTSRYILNMSFPFLYIYMMLSGIYTIAKTSSTWLFVFLVVAIIGLDISVVIEIILKIKNKKNPQVEKAQA